MTRRCPATSLRTSTTRAKLFMKQTDSIDYDFTHVSGGKGFAIIQKLGDNFYKVAPITKHGIGMNAFLAWGKRMDRTRVPVDPKDKHSPLRDVPLEGEVLEKVRAMREDINAGRVKIENQCIVAA